MAKQENTQEKEVIYAGLSDRMLAGAIDLALLYFIVTPLSFILFPLVLPNGDVMQQAYALAISQQPELAGQSEKLLQFIIDKHPEMLGEIFRQYITKTAVQITIIGAAVVPFIYRKGATPGKMVAGVKVVDGITYSKLTLSQSLIRFLAYIPSMLFLGIGVLWGNFNSRKRTWHDILADTVVIMDENRWYKRLWHKIIGKK